MTKYYDVILINKARNRKSYYLADSFSVNDDRVLKIYSKEYGNVVLQIGNDEELSIKEIELKEWWDELEAYDNEMQTQE